MGLFDKHCAYCGSKIEKGQDIVQNGKHFDSQGHADLFSKKIEEEHASQGHNHSCGCC